MQSLLARHLSRPLKKRPLRRISQKTSTFSLVIRYTGQLWAPLGNLSYYVPLCLAQELIGLPRSSFNIGPAKMPSHSWRISCAHSALALFTLVLMNTILWQPILRQLLMSPSSGESFVTLLSFLWLTEDLFSGPVISMGTAWASTEAYPWEHGLYVGGIETAKVNLTLRIYSNAWHVYAGLAILNPSARTQIHQYAKSASELFKLMLSGGSGSLEDKVKFKERVQWARRTVFGRGGTIIEKDKDDWENGSRTPLSDPSRPPSPTERKPILLSASILDKFSLGKHQSSDITVPESPTVFSVSSTLMPPSNYRPNSHLSLLAMVDCWAHLGINPYVHLDLAATPIFRLFLGVAEHLFQSLTLLESALHSAIYDHWHRADDLEFVVAARGWSQCVRFGNFEDYKRRFEETRQFFQPRFDEAGKLGSEMIKAVMETEVIREEEERRRLGLWAIVKTDIRYCVRFPFSICDHRFRQICDKMRYRVMVGKSMTRASNRLISNVAILHF